MSTVSSEPFSYHPPPGGDTSLKSADGVVFLVHSVLLGMASSVFTDMFSTATQRDLIELSDDAESVSLMLRFIYPPTFLDDLPLALLEKSLRIAQKYDVGGIITSVDHLIMFHPSNENGPIRSDPIRTFCLAATYGLPNTQKAAAEALRPEHFRFEDPDEIMPFVETFPSAASPIGLLGAHCVRAQALSDLLFGKRMENYLPFVLGGQHHKDTIMCFECFKRVEHEFEIGCSYEPVWIAYWAIMAFDSLMTEPYDACADLFHPSALDRIASKPGLCLDCIRATRNADDGHAFLRRAKKMEAQVKRIFDDVEHLCRL
ncbi:hypothetical protein FS749_009858 [Ceratobasidium sp. UAMH 11750]|nr:hypothetical protein FS749_009858 [Ceratobasidium sp. UAMH 11750]